VKNLFALLLLWPISVSGVLAQGTPITGTNIVTSSYQNRSLRATNSIELQPGFSVSTPGFEARVVLDPIIAGSWSEPLPWLYEDGGAPYVGIHTHVLPNGKVLSWEGHNDNEGPVDGHWDSHGSIWDVQTGSFSKYDNDTTNVFCSGHAFLPDGRLFVAGGHYGKYPGVPLLDDLSSAPVQPGYIGLQDANTFDWLATTVPQGAPWELLPPMQDRRWYPTVTTLLNGKMLVIAGQRYGGAQSVIPEIWDNGTWTRLTGAANVTLPYYPWMFAAPGNKVFYAGSGGDTRYLDITTGTWGPPLATLLNLNREYGTAAMYAKGKILIVGGGLVNGTNTSSAEWIDLTAGTPIWRSAGQMQYPRMHPNATLLPNGQVLVTGGNREPTINEHAAVLPAEVWTPPTTATGTGTWQTLAPMQIPRLYHATAVLLPDGRVLSAGGGQGADFITHKDYEVFSPPYLFSTAPRPAFASAPVAVRYGQSFNVQMAPDPATMAPIPISKVRMIRLSSVTHAINMSQLGLTLSFGSFGNTLGISPPTSAEDWCPPGHYLLFAESTAGVPSEGRIVHISASNCSTPTTLTLAVDPQPRTTDCTVTRIVRATGQNISPGAVFNWTIDGVPVAGNGPTCTFTQGLNYPDKSQQRIAVSVVPTCDDVAVTANTLVVSYFPDCTPD
jgi:galactose oxidase